MAHHERLRLRKHKGISELDLLDLKRVNVVSGPNNGGKTTVLECIADAKLHSPGIVASSELASKLAGLSVRAAGWASNPSYDRKYEQLILSALKSHDVLFPEDGDAVWAEIAQHWASNFGAFADPGNAFRQAFQNGFPKSPSSALVPAKRRLETTKQLNSSDQVEPDGAGLINFVFTARSQDETSDRAVSFHNMVEAFKAITGGYFFDVHLLPENHVELRFRSDSTQWIKAEDSGLGLHDLLIIIFHALAPQYDVVLIEEPESHLHPEIQRRLAEFLRGQQSKQFFLSTHSSVFLNTQFAEHVMLCRYDGKVSVDTATTRAGILTELGYSIADNLVSDVIILCEGPHDKGFLEEFLEKKSLMTRTNIKVWPLGGDIMSKVDLSVFAQNYKVMALVDRDPGSSVVRTRFENRCKEYEIACHRLERYSLENYFSIRALREVLGNQIPAKLTALDPDKSVAKQLELDVKKNSARIAKAMTLDEIKGTDLADFLDAVEQQSARAA
jgi:ABC-type cobalamin/Fe3+-siderophores transport system ATPase subunit